MLREYIYFQRQNNIVIKKLIVHDMYSTFT